MKPQQIICILGMHRSGTSLVSKILNILGIYLGPEAHIMQPGPHNPKGHWEHNMLTALNDEILARFGGSWHEVPVFPPGWETSPELADLRQRARAILQEDFATAELWGWKDPRNCLTLPFWQRLLPSMKYVICLRNPVDVARSLEQRDGFSLEKGVHLWLTHVKSALEHTAGQPRLFIFYEDVMENWQLELERLAQFLERPKLAAQPEIQKAVQEFIEEELQHHRTSILDVVDEPKLAFPAKALYMNLHLLVKLHREDEFSKANRILQDAIDQLGVYALTSQEEIARLRQQSAEQEQALVEKAQRLIQLQAQLAERERAVQGLQAQLAEAYAGTEALQAQLAERELRVQNLEVQLAEIQAQAQAEQERLTQQLQQRLGWKRYLIADKLAAFYWHLCHPKQLWHFTKDRAWQFARQWLPMPVKFWIKRVILRRSSPHWQPPQLANAQEQHSLDRIGKGKQPSESLARTPIIITHKMEEIATRVSVVIPTKNAASEDFEGCLRGITQQKGLKELEIIVVDSGSSDDTVEIAKSYGAKIFSIPPEQFDHGATRNYGGDRASGELLVFTVHDAVPASDELFYAMAKMLLSDPKLAAVSVCQIPRSDADLFACWQIWNHYQYVGRETRISDIEDPKKMDVMSIQELRRVAGLDDVCSMHRKSIWEKLKYKPTDFAEDLEYGIRCLKTKYKIGFLGDQAVIHSHNRPAFYHLSKYYIDQITLLKFFKDKDTDSKKWQKMGISTIDQLLSCAKDLYYALNEFGESVQSSTLYEPTGFLKELQDFLLTYQPPANGLSKGEPTLDKFFSHTDKIFEYSAPKINPCREAFQGNIKNLSGFLGGRYPSLSGSDLLDLLYKMYAMVVGADLGDYYARTVQHGTPLEKLEKLDNLLRGGILR